MTRSLLHGPITLLKVLHLPVIHVLPILLEELEELDTRLLPVFAPHPPGDAQLALTPPTGAQRTLPQAQLVTVTAPPFTSRFTAHCHNKDKLPRRLESEK